MTPSVDSIKDVVRRASALMASKGFAVEQKGDCTNIVTSSDIAVQRFLCHELSTLFPGCGFICEEDEMHDPDKEYVWVIDPIDGTANYARGIDHCAISVALCHGCEPVIGVVYSPMREEMYWAEKSKGAWCNGKPIHTSDRPFVNGLFCTAMSTYRKEFAGVCNDVIMEAYYQCNDVRRFGAASIELCFMAAGIIELYFEIRLQPWDYAAGMLILEEAGGKISSLGGAPLSLTHPDLVCAANSAENHRRLLSIIEKHIPSIPYEE